MFVDVIPISFNLKIGILNNFQLDKSVFMKDGLTFQNARQKCMLMNGDIMSLVDDARTAAMLKAASASVQKVWVGLFRMKTGQTYQWTEELMKLSYAAKQIEIKDIMDKEERLKKDIVY
ncbi:hypothetical protein HELRODRAFT_161038 [Helobdella robusta]|uniref:C-type lectin domain-containing protein n=1 Tax=Helobdella robusta TaxID=6412 RepID=T1ER17_HELRO|nr:hypothetical protein HELRODRAFT_161038 [Helobdella robusta]ESO01860.1 hypothetical protein HELRODRAFT_161038 [Helobdella robusta]